MAVGSGVGVALSAVGLALGAALAPDGVGWGVTTALGEARGEAVAGTSLAWAESVASGEGDGDADALGVLRGAGLPVRPVVGAAGQPATRVASSTQSAPA